MSGRAAGRVAERRRPGWAASNPLAGGPAEPLGPLRVQMTDRQGWVVEWTLEDGPGGMWRCDTAAISSRELAARLQAFVS